MPDITRRVCSREDRIEEIFDWIGWTWTQHGMIIDLVRLRNIAIFKKRMVYKFLKNESCDYGARIKLMYIK